MKRRNFFKSLCAIAVAGTLPVDIMASQSTNPYWNAKYFYQGVPIITDDIMAELVGAQGQHFIFTTNAVYERYRRLLEVNP